MAEPHPAHDDAQPLQDGAPRPTDSDEDLDGVPPALLACAYELERQFDEFTAFLNPSPAITTSSSTEVQTSNLEHITNVVGPADYNDILRIHLDHNTSVLGHDGVRKTTTCYFPTSGSLIHNIIIFMTNGEQ